MHVSCIDPEADLLAGGVDGAYQLSGCFHGKPLYRRTEVAGEERSLYFNALMGCWEISIGPDPDEDQLILYGDYGSVAPLDVSRFHLAASFSSLHRQRMASDVSASCSVRERWKGRGREHADMKMHPLTHTYTHMHTHPRAPAASQDDDAYFVLAAAAVTCVGDPDPTCTIEETTCSRIHYDEEEDEGWALYS
jgi:hypothetical protein